MDSLLLCSDTVEQQECKGWIATLMARLMYKAADKTMGAEKTKLEGREKKHMQTVHENKTAGEQTGDVMDVTAVVPGGL